MLFLLILSLLWSGRACPYTYEICIDVLGFKGKMVQTYVNIHTEQERERDGEIISKQTWQMKTLVNLNKKSS